MKFKEYYDDCNGHYIAFEKVQDVILILDAKKKLVRTVYASKSVGHLQLTFETLFEKHFNEHNIDVELEVFVDGHNQRDYLYMPNIVMRL